MGETPYSYPDPVSKLLALGEPPLGAWRVYRRLGLARRHIPDLIRMATDDDLYYAGGEGPRSWAPLHAWRALGELRAEAAIGPLVGLLRRVDEEDDDWLLEDLPEVFGMIGLAAAPVLAAHLADSRDGRDARVVAAEGIQRIGTRHPEGRDECVRLLTSQLERFSGQDRDLNGFLVANLMDLKAVEAAPLVERAFAANCVDVSMAGDWEEVQVRMGLKPARETPAPHFSNLEQELARAQSAPGGQHRSKPDGQARAKAKRKQAAQSRKQNRKR